MSDILPEETNRYLRINRKELIADTNLINQPRLDSIISSPVQLTDKALLYSRVGGSNRLPVPGYCLHFDSVNVISPDSIFIQTNILSTDRDNYNIIIKGEGTIDLLKVDTSNTNIRIVPKQAITDSDYFDLSYIAFKNRTTGKIDHLFECEENSGILLYDAVTGDTATITSTSGNIVSLTTLRGSTSYKEWIIDEDDNLNNAIAVKNTWAYNNSVKNIPASYSLCMTLAITKEQFDTTAAIGNINLCGNVNGYNLADWILISGTSWSIRFNYRNNDLASTIYSCIIPLWIDSYNVKYLDGKPHKYVACVDAETKTLKTYVDGVYVNSNGNQILSYTPVDFIATNQFDIGTNNHYRLDGGFKISNIKRFDFAMDATDAPYTLQDYQNGKDIPENVIPLIDLVNISKSPESAGVWSGLWLDRSPNNHNLKFCANTTYNNSYIAVTKNYGTWCNGVGYNNITVLLDPTIYDSIIWGYSSWYNSHFSVRSSDSDSLIVKHTGSDISRLSTPLTFTYNNYKFNGKRIHIRVGDIRCTFSDGSYTDSRPDQLVVGVNRSIGGVTNSQRLVTIDNYSVTDGKLEFDFNIPDDWENVSRLYLEIYFSSTVTITDNDFVKYKDVKVWVDDFENITIPEETLNKFTNPKLPRKLLN